MTNTASTEGELEKLVRKYFYLTGYSNTVNMEVTKHVKEILAWADRYAATMAREELEKLQDWGSWMTEHCDNHEKYTSACCGCQRASAALHTIESYKDWQVTKIAALASPDGENQ